MSVTYNTWCLNHDGPQPGDVVYEPYEIRRPGVVTHIVVNPGYNGNYYKFLVAIRWSDGKTSNKEVLYLQSLDGTIEKQRRTVENHEKRREQLLKEIQDV